MYPTAIATSIGIVAKNFRVNTTEPIIAVIIVTKNTQTSALVEVSNNMSAPIRPPGNSNSRKFQTYQRNNRSHCSRRKNNIYPVSFKFVDYIS